MVEKLKFGLPLALASDVCASLLNHKAARNKLSQDINFMETSDDPLKQRM